MLLDTPFVTWEQDGQNIQKFGRIVPLLYLTASGKIATNVFKLQKTTYFAATLFAITKVADCDLRSRQM